MEPAIVVTDLALFAHVSANDTGTVDLLSRTAGAVDLASSTLRACVETDT